MLLCHGVVTACTTALNAQDLPLGTCKTFRDSVFVSILLEPLIENVTLRSPFVLWKLPTPSRLLSLSPTLGALALSPPSTLAY